MTNVRRDPLAGQILDAAIKVHRNLGPGLLESSYEVCLHYELTARGLRVERQVALPVVYEEITLDCGYRLDLFVNRAIVIEVKSVEKVLPIHEAQVLTYLRLSGARQVLLFNFNSVRLIDGMRSFLADGKQRSRQAGFSPTRGEPPFPRAPGIGGSACLRKSGAG